MPGEDLRDDYSQTESGTPLDLDWVAGAHVNKSAVERRTTTLTKRRTVKKTWQAAWLLRAVTCIDLTTLAGDDTPGRVRRLCAKARQPIRPDMLADSGWMARRLPWAQSVFTPTVSRKLSRPYEAQTSRLLRLRRVSRLARHPCLSALRDRTGHRSRGA